MCNRKGTVEPMALDCSNGLGYHDIRSPACGIVLIGRRIIGAVQDASVITSHWPFSRVSVPADQCKQALGLDWVCDTLPCHGKNS